MTEASESSAIDISRKTEIAIDSVTSHVLRLSKGLYQLVAKEKGERNV